MTTPPTLEASITPDIVQVDHNRYCLGFSRILTPESRMDETLDFVEAIKNIGWHPALIRTFTGEAMLYQPQPGQPMSMAAGVEVVAVAHACGELMTVYAAGKSPARNGSTEDTNDDD